MNAEWANRPMDRGLAQCHSAHMASDLPALYARIGGLLERSRAEVSDPALWSEVEDVLTEGYAHVLTLESRRLRHRQHAEELAAGPEDGDATRGEIRGLLQLAAGSGDELRRLRGLLTALREHAGRAERAASL
jgi:hypothetical protein